MDYPYDYDRTPNPTLDDPYCMDLYSTSFEGAIAFPAQVIYVHRVDLVRYSAFLGRYEFRQGEVVTDSIAFSNVMSAIRRKYPGWDFRDSYEIPAEDITDENARAEYLAMANAFIQEAA